MQPRWTWPAVALFLAGVAGCGYTGQSTAFDRKELDESPGWVAAREVPVIHQKTTEDCGAAALAMIFADWNVPATAEDISALVLPGKGASARDLRELARRNGLRCFLIHGVWEDLENELCAGRPVIVGLVKPTSTGAVTHYEVVVAVHPERHLVVTHDPALGPRRYTLEGFRREWDPAGYLTLVFSLSQPAD